MATLVLRLGLATLPMGGFMEFNERKTPRRSFDWGAERARCYQRGVLLIRLPNHRFHDFGIALHGEHDGALLDAVATGRHDRDHLTAIRHA